VPPITDPDLVEALEPVAHEVRRRRR
jgi:hypothetical protein